jgi:hypothetical protein
MDLHQEKIIVKMDADQKGMKTTREAQLEMSNACLEKKPSANEMMNLAAHPEDSNIAKCEETIGAT